MSRKKTIVSILIVVTFCLFMHHESVGQTFEPLTYSQRTKGIVDWNQKDQVVLYGTGLIWMKTDGTILDEQRIIAGLPSSDIIDACLAKDGGLYLLTKKGLGWISSEKQGLTIFTREDFPDADFEEIEIGKDGTLYCLRKNGIIEVSPDKTFRSVYSSDKRDKYFKHFTFDDRGNFYIASYKEVHKIDAQGNHTNYKFDRNVNLQDIAYTSDGRIIVLEYRDIYELKDGKLTYFLQGKQLSRGLKFYEFLFDSSNNFWLYTLKGNAFHNDNGTWKNYTPPADLKTGNYGEHLTKSQNGDIWMTLAGQMILRFDGNKWTKYNVDKEKEQIKLARAKMFRGGHYIVKNTESKRWFEFKNAELHALKGMPDPQSAQFEYDQNNTLYWSKENAIYKLVNGKKTKVLEHNAIKDFAISGNQIIYNSDKKVWISENGKTEELKNNVHYMGWDDISSSKLISTYDDKVIAYSKSNVFSIYDGQTWKKITSVDGKKIVQILKVIPLENRTIIALKYGRILELKEDKLSFLYEPSPIQKNTSYNFFGCQDNTIWMIDNQKNVVYLSEEKQLNFQIPLDKNSAYIRAIVPVKEGVYDIYFNSTTLRITL